MEGATGRSAGAVLALVAVGFGTAAAGCGRLVRTRPDLVRSENPCVDTQFTVCFGENSNRLTRPAGQLIQEAGRTLKNCTIDRARMVGLSDATGGSEANRTPSQQRAVAVAGALRGRSPETTGSAGAVLRDRRQRRGRGDHRPGPGRSGPASRRGLPDRHAALGFTAGPGKGRAPQGARRRRIIRTGVRRRQTGQASLKSGGRHRLRIR